MQKEYIHVSMDEENKWQVLDAQELPCVRQLASYSLLMFLCKLMKRSQSHVNNC